MNIRNNLKQIFLLFLLPSLCLAILSLLTSSQIAYASSLKVFTVTIWLTLWWATGIVPLGATSLLPIILFPSFDILGMKEVLHSYANPILFLFLGGFLYATAVQQSGLHTRIAINIMLYAGRSPRLLVLGIMIGTACTSMFMSNTVTALMMFPIITGLCLLFGEGVGEDTDNIRSIQNFRVVVMLAVAYSASIGGMATIIGSPPNAITVGVIKDILGQNITFTEWLYLAVPIMLLLLAIAWITLFFFYPVINIDMKRILGYLIEEKKKLGAFSKQEKAVMMVGCFLLLGWVLDSSWGIPLLSTLSDSQVSLLGVMLLFGIKIDNKALLDSSAFSKVEWNILYMFGAGFALSGAYTLIPLKEIFSEIFSVFPTQYPLMMSILFCLIAGFATELTSNSSVTILLLPITATLAQDFSLSPLHMMMGVCFASSCAFMFPASTPSNAIIFGSGYVKVSDLIRVGVVLTILSALFLGVYSYFVLPQLFAV